MTHFKATHEPFDYPERYANKYKNQEIPEPESLYDFEPKTNGRSFIGQKLDILRGRWEKGSEQIAAGKYSRYPGLPFSTKGMDKIQARKKTYQKFVKDFMRCGASIDDNIGKLIRFLKDFY